MDAAERLGGEYSPHLHPQCTHLVVQISFLLTSLFPPVSILLLHCYFLTFKQLSWTEV